MTDILFKADGDLYFTPDGDIAYGESTDQHKRDLLLAKKGDYKTVPSVGVGSYRFLKDDSVEEWLTTIRKEFTKDGMKVKRVAYDNNNLQIVASYDS